MLTSDNAAFFRNGNFVGAKQAEAPYGCFQFQKYAQVIPREWLKTCLKSATAAKSLRPLHRLEKKRLKLEKQQQNRQQIFLDKAMNKVIRDRIRAGRNEVPVKLESERFLTSIRQLLRVSKNERPLV
uniref:Transposase n=1 Tax=Syphacia muris TaxID=451379 RepID=A0A0N5A8C3_9BILA